MRKMHACPGLTSAHSPMPPRQGKFIGSIIFKGDLRLLSVSGRSSPPSLEAVCYPTSPQAMDIFPTPVRMLQLFLGQE